jgi:hypothetical protein
MAHFNSHVGITSSENRPPLLGIMLFKSDRGIIELSENRSFLASGRSTLSLAGRNG